MHIAGVVAEYNPFHNGHAYHLQKTRAMGADAVVAVMSGNFVQRGEAAILSKWARAEAAVRCGVDLVLELPLYWAASGAQNFAFGAVSTLSHLGCVQSLSFGSECGDVRQIRTVADLTQDLRVGASMRSALDRGVTFAAAREAAVRTLFGDAMADVLHSPNDTLAMEYCLAAQRCGADFDFWAVPRVGAAHDSEDGQDGFRSASAIRSALRKGGDMEHCPDAVREIWCREKAALRAPASLETLERMILSKLRSASPQEIAALPDVCEGLENRILQAASRADSLAALYDLAKTKRYTHARIRRIVLSALLDIRKADIPQDVPYIRVLGIGKRGAEILRAAKSTADLPVYTKMTQALSANEKRVFDAECRSTELYSLLLPRIVPAGAEYTTPVFVL